MRRSWMLSGGLRPNRPPCLGCGSGASWTNMSVSRDASQGPLGELLGASGRLFGASWGLPGGVLEASWGLLGAPRGPLGGCWGHLGEKGSKCQFVLPLLGSLGALLGLSWAILGVPGAVLGPSWAVLGPPLGPLGGLIGRLGTILGAPRAVFDAVKTTKPSVPKMYVFRREWDDFFLLGPSRRSSGGTLGPSWRPRAPS